MDNAGVAELLARASEQAEGNLQKALRRASRHALTWPDEVADLAERGELRALDGVGPHLERILVRWLEDDEPVPTPPPVRAGFLTLPRVRAILAKHPGLGMRGDLQSHTTWSDGGVSVAELAALSEAQGLEYQAVTDHSKGLKIAGGMDEDELARQGYEIEDVNERYVPGGFRLLRSIEMNLSVTGEGDMDPKALAGLDVVLGSFHSKLRLKEDQTERYLAALRNPDVHILGHPQGRMYNFRPGLSADWGRVFAEATRLGKAVEIDAFPDRQDLKVELLGIAADEGTTISIGSDAHWPGQIAFVEFGLAAALEAGIPPDRILNLKPVEDLMDWVAELRDRTG
ncbi:MAG TPA: PHP domain-containing protein [Actinomycetota bacterium]|nr:PHP domain-containing protein [Actinomycetota bacterium]